MKILFDSAKRRYPQWGFGDGLFEDYEPEQPLVTGSMLERSHEAAEAEEWLGIKASLFGNPDGGTYCAW